MVNALGMRFRFHFVGTIINSEGLHFSQLGSSSHLFTIRIRVDRYTQPLQAWKQKGGRLAALVEKSS
jgi:hypothetical protein